MMELWLIIVLAWIVSCIIWYIWTKVFKNEETIKTILECLCFGLPVVLFIVGIITLSVKTNFKSTLQYLKNTESNIVLFYESSKDNFKFITPCKNEIDDYNSSLNSLVSSVNCLRLEEREKLKDFYNYYLDINTLELIKEPVNIK